MIKKAIDILESDLDKQEKELEYYVKENKVKLNDPRVDEVNRVFYRLMEAFKVEKFKSARQKCIKMCREHPEYDTKEVMYHMYSIYSKKLLSEVEGFLEEKDIKEYPDYDKYVDEWRFRMIKKKMMEKNIQRIKELIKKVKDL